MFVMHFMGTPYSPEIGIICFPKHFKTLMYENIMHKEVSHSIDGDPQAYPKEVIIAGLHPKEKSGNPRDSKNEKEKVIVLKKAGGLLVVMVFMQRPQQTVHYEFMSKPGNAFHSKEGRQNY